MAEWKTKRSRKRLIGLGAVLLVLAVLILFAPPIVAGTFGPGLIASRVQATTGGQVAIDDLSLSWLGEQNVNGLTVTNGERVSSADVNVVLRSGLLSLITGVEQYDIALSGGATVSMAGDEDEEDAEGDGGDGSNGGALDEGMDLPAFSIDLTSFNLAIDLRDDQPIRAARLTSLDGNVAVGPNGEASIDLESPVDVARGNGGSAAGEDGGDEDAGGPAIPQSGVLAIKGTLSNLRDASGLVQPKRATGRLTVDIADVDLPSETGLTKLETLAVGMDLAGGQSPLRIAINGRGASAGDLGNGRTRGGIAGDPPMTLDASVDLGPSLERIIDRPGEARVDATAEARMLPTAILAMFTPRDQQALLKDLGERVDLSMTVATADADGDAADGARGEGDGSDERRSFHEALDGMPGASGGDPWTGRFTLLAATSGAIDFDDASPGASDVALEQAPFALRASGSIIGLKALAGANINGRLTAGAGTIRELTGAEAAQASRISIDASELSIVRLGEGGPLPVLPTGGNATARIDGRFTFALPASGDEDGEAAVPAADRRVRIESPSLTLAITDSAAETGALTTALSVRANVDDAPAMIDSSITYEGEVASFGETTGSATLTPGLLALLQGETKSPVTLADRTPIRATIQPFRISVAPTSSEEGEADPSPGAAAGSPLLDAVAMRIDVEPATLSHAALTGPLLIQQLRADVRYAPPAGPNGVATATAVGSGRIRIPYRERRVADLGFDVALDLPSDPDAQLQPKGEVSLTRIDVIRLEELLALERGAIADWTERDAALAIDLDSSLSSRSIVAKVETPWLHGTVALQQPDQETVIVESRGVRYAAPALAVQHLLAPDDETGDADGDDGASIAVAEDVPVHIEEGSLTIPLALFAGDEATARAASAADAASAVQGSFRTAAGPIIFQVGDGLRETIDALSITASVNDLAQGIGLEIAGSTLPRNTGGPVPTAGALAATGRIGNLISETGELQPKSAALTLDATLENIPTAAADALLGLDGLLVAAIGPNLTNGTITAKDFSRGSGWTEVDLQTTNSRLTGRAKALESALRTTANDPPHATLALSPELRNRLLERIHPLLADIRTVEQPITMDVTKPFVLPLDGDLSKLRGDLELTFGKVELDSGSISLLLLRAFETGRPVVPGYIEPVRVSIRQGVVTYEQFAVQIDKYRFEYSGEIDLVQRRINLRSTLPIEALSGTFQELEGYVEGLQVPFVTVGTLEDYETKIDPDFDLAGQLLRNTIQKELGGEIQKQLDDIFKGLGGLGR